MVNGLLAFMKESTFFISLFYAFIFLCAFLLTACATTLDLFQTPRVRSTLDASVPFENIEPDYRYATTQPLSTPPSVSAQSQPVDTFQQKALRNPPKWIPITASDSYGSEQGVVQINPKSNLTRNPIRLAPLTHPTPEFQSPSVPDYPSGYVPQQPPSQRPLPQYPQGYLPKQLPGYLQPGNPYSSQDYRVPPPGLSNLEPQPYPNPGDRYPDEVFPPQPNFRPAY